MRNEITLVEVAPRDGLQNEKQIVPTKIKLQFIELLAASGLPVIEATSFVSPTAIPQMADHHQVMMHLRQDLPTRFSALVPNEEGLKNALDAGTKEIAIFTAASETFAQKNIHRSISHSLQEYAAVITEAKRHYLRVRGYISCALGCPYEGKVDIRQVLFVAKTLFGSGCDEIALADTIGVGTPMAAQELVKTISSEIPISQLAIHFHDTYGQALANILACLEIGITTIDCATASLGGCPYAKGATGNVATEEVLYMLEGLGLHTGVDMHKIITAGQFICDYLHIPNRSKVATAMLAKCS